MGMEGWLYLYSKIDHDGRCEEVQTQTHESEYTARFGPSALARAWLTLYGGESEPSWFCFLKLGYSEDQLSDKAVWVWYTDYKERWEGHKTQTG